MPLDRNSLLMNTEPESIIINEVQLLLAEKRTSLAALRTGIAVSALPLTALSLLIATSEYYDVINVMHLFVPVLLICLILIIIGFYLIIRSIIKIRHHDRMILEIKKKHRTIADFID